MRAEGFSYWPVPRVPHPDLRDFPYGVDDVDWARGHGFGRRIEQQLDEEAAASPRARYQSGLPRSGWRLWGWRSWGPTRRGWPSRTRAAAR